jgi:hypothetical protein
VKSNLVEHAAKIDQTADFLVRTAETGNMRHASTFDMG